MPLRDHFRPPVEDEHSWDELHGMWPAVIVQQLFPILPEGYVAAPACISARRSRSTYRPTDATSRRPRRGRAAVRAVSRSRRRHLPDRPSRWRPTSPTRTSTRCRIHDAQHGRRLVAAIEIISPSNKDRPESRRAFAARVAALLRSDVCVSLVDLVTIRQFNLYTELLDLIGGSDPMLGTEPPSVYAVTARGRRRAGRRPLLDTWFDPMEPGRPLPTLPIWLADDLGVSLDLEAGYEEACRVLRIP